MGKDSEPAPTPDPNIGKAALKSAELGEEWLAFAKEAFAVSEVRQADLDDLTKRVTESQIDFSETQLAFAKEDRDRYKNTFQPIEDEFIKEASEYRSPERQAEAAAEAKADVERASSEQEAQLARSNAALGINPTSGRFQGIQRAAATDTALASAGAQNQARKRQRDTGLALKSDVVNIGRGLPAQSSNAAALGLSAGAGAVGLKQGANAQYIGSTGIVDQGFGGAQSGYSSQANILNNQYRGELDAWKTQQSINAQNASGIGKGIGAIIGALPWTSSEEKKTDKAPIEDGAALEAVNEMPVEEWTYKKGVEDEGRHVGPYAEGFKSATGLGNGISIAPQDAIGITMKAVQDLSNKVDNIADAVGSNKPPAKKKKRKIGAGIGLGDTGRGIAA